LATGDHHGFTGANFLVAAVLVTIALGIILWRVLDRVPAAPVAVAEG